MDLHEYQAKQLLSKYGVPVIEGQLAYTPLEAVKAAKNLGGGPMVVKAQVHAGGRGKGGGVKFCPTMQDVEEHATNIIGMTLVTPQTGEEGKHVKKVWVTPADDIEKEYYLSLVVDRENCGVSFVASAEGGVEIEKVAEETPSATFSISTPPSALSLIHI